MKCDKIGFLTRQDAKNARKKFNLRKGIKKLTNVYWCTGCNAYHLTSMNKEQSRNIERKLKRRSAPSGS